MKPKLSLLARMWQRVTAYANQSTIHGEYIFHTFNLEPLSGPIFLLSKNLQEYPTCYLATSSAESSGWLLFLLLPQAIGYDFFLHSYTFPSLRRICSGEVIIHSEASQAAWNVSSLEAREVYSPLQVPPTSLFPSLPTGRQCERSPVSALL